jgi:Tol biopolymer transport system component
MMRDVMERGRLTWLMVAAFALVTSVCVGTGAGAAGRTGLIAFEAGGGLYTVPATGGDPRRIRGTLPGDGNPRWSPDGKRLSFERFREGSWDVYVMDADGGNQRRLTFSDFDDDFAAWAPHGRSLVFQSRRDGGVGIYVIDVKSGAARRVTKDGHFPDWMPDGRILFTDDVSRELHTVRPYGASRRSLPTPIEATGARVSDSGDMIVLQRGRPAAIYTARADGSDEREQAASPNWDRDPILSPDGKWIVFDSTPTFSDPPNDIYLVAVNGNQRIRLTTMASACCPDWSFTASMR